MLRKILRNYTSDNITELNFLFWCRVVHGASWSNLFKAANPAFGITGSLGFTMLFIIISIIFHFVLTLYLAAVLPNKYDVPKSPLFFLQVGPHSNCEICGSFRFDFISNLCWIVLVF